MNQIFNLIVRIFQAIFEEDFNRRTGQNQQAAKAPAGQKPGAQGRAGRASNQKGAAQAPSMTLEAYLNQVLEQDRQRQARTAVPKRRSGSHELRPSAARTSPAPTKRNTGAARPKARGSQGDFTLPGKNTLEKMIYANVILGPCKAHRHRSPRGLD